MAKDRSIFTTPPSLVISSNGRNGLAFRSFRILSIVIADFRIIEIEVWRNYTGSTRTAVP